MFCQELSKNKLNNCQRKRNVVAKEEEEEEKNKDEDAKNLQKSTKPGGEVKQLSGNRVPS